MLSFNLELHKIFQSKKAEKYQTIPNNEIINEKNSEAKAKKENSENALLSEAEYLKALSNSAIALEEFNILNYFVYIFYAPVYFSGPTILFNSFITQINNNFSEKESNNINNFKAQKEFELNNKITKANLDLAQNKTATVAAAAAENDSNFSIALIKNPLNFKNKLIYLLRYIFVVICFEIFNRYIYVNLYLTNPNNSYVLKNEKFNYYSYSLFCFFLLIFIWFKFTVIWRTARIWAMFDDILTEENMNRCMYNNYCFEGFWRAWHRSFNVWLIRYIFVPLGGSSYKFLNVWIVFTFVALWHDLQLKLLLWGWFICFFMIPEIFVKKIFNGEKVI